MLQARGLHDCMLLCYICFAHLLRHSTKVTKCVHYITCISAFRASTVSSHSLHMLHILRSKLRAIYDHLSCTDDRLIQVH